jgi:hypothetical protein
MDLQWPILQQWLAGFFMIAETETIEGREAVIL